MENTTRQRKEWEVYCKTFAEGTAILGGPIHNAFTHGYMAGELNSGAEELLEALRGCFTDEGAAGYIHVAKYGRRRMQAINQIALAALAKYEGR